MKRWIRIALLLIAALVLAPGCSKTKIVEVPVEVKPDPVIGEHPPLDGSIFPQVGSESFLTATENEYLPNNQRNGYSPGVAGGDMMGASENSDGVTTSDPMLPQMPTPDPTREIVEADIFKVDGDYLYLMNSYRGLVIVDIKEIDKPTIVGRVPFQGQPVEMYVEKGRAYVIMSDYFTYWMFDADADPLGFHGSQVLVVDVQKPSDPQVLGSVNVEGEVTDSRLVGDVLYAVSKRNANYWRYNTLDWEDTTWVVSLDITNPKEIKAVDRVEFSGTSNLIHVAPHAIFVAAYDPNYYISDSTFERETLVTYVDISDPKGKIGVRGSIYIPGVIQDRFKMDFYERSLRIFSRRYVSTKEITLTSVDLTYPDDLKVAGVLEIDARYSSLMATRFSGPNAYAVIRNYPYDNYSSDLWSFDVADATAPKYLNRVTFPGYCNQLVAKGDRLLGLGQVWENPAGYYQNRAALFLFNVANPALPALQSFTTLGSKYSYTNANYDDKALRIVDELGLVLLPLSWSEGNQYYQGTQIVSWADDTLTERGRVRHFGQVQRAVAVKNRLLAISNNQIQIIDAADLDNPQITAQRFLVRTVYELFNVQGLAVQILSVEGESTVHVEVLEFSKDDDTTPIAKLDLPYSGAPLTFRDGDMVHMLGYEATKGQVFRTLDLSDPKNPKLRGELVLTDEINKFYTQGLSFYSYYWSSYSGLPLNNRLFPVTARTIVEDDKGRRNFQNELRILDLSDPDNPRFTAAKLPLPDYPFINKATHGSVLYSNHVEDALDGLGNKLGFHVKSYLDRIDVSDSDNPKQLKSLNIPGRFIDIDESGKVIYTVDYQWDEFGRRRNSLNVLEIVGDVAVLKAVIPVGDQIDRALFRDKTIYVTTHKYPWWGMQGDTLESRQPYTKLELFEFADTGRLVSQKQTLLKGYFFNLLDVQGSVAFLASTYPYGVLSLGVKDIENPVILNASRTVGYVSRLQVQDGYIYFPLSSYGVRRAPIQ
ncbi:MAG: beta-propeller domain-containing protein [Myxococcales bacterium]|nr:beta-propeller domain-containing protein [Myxococcales bacterium]